MKSLQKQKKGIKRNMIRNRLQIRIRTMTVFFFLFSFSAGCVQDVEAPRRWGQQSAVFYEKAVRGYQRLLARRPQDKTVRVALAELYANHGDYQNAITSLRDVEDIKAKEFLAICLYKAGEYTQALATFERLGKIPSGEYLYYYGLTCQKHNLYDQALELFAQIKDKEYVVRARERIAAIKGVNQKYLNTLEPALQQALMEATQEKYPLAGAVIILVDEKITLLADNTLATQAHYIIKILNERGKNDFSEIVLGYDSTYETVEVAYAKTIKPNGEEVSVGEKDIRDVSRYLNFPLYSNARARIISMPEITEGAIVEYKISSTQRQLINKKDFDTVYTLQENEPILCAKFSVSIPKNRDLKIKALNPEYNTHNFNLAGNMKETDGAKMYSWEFRDIPQIEIEPNMPPVSEITPVILLSTFNSWDEIYQWWWDLAKDRITPDEAITQKANELIKGKNSQEDKIRAMYNYCAQEIRYVGIEYGQAGYQPHYASEIFKNKYGDCKDKAILFVTMLKALGIEAYPVLIGTRGTPEAIKDFPEVIFNHCIAALELEGKRIFLDITAEVCSFGDLPYDDQERNALVFKKDGYEIAATPGILPDKNFIKYITKITLHNNETISAQREVVTLGAFDQMQRFWLRYTPPNLIEQGLKEKVQSMVTSGDLLSYTYENAEDLNIPVRLTYAFRGKNFLSRAGRARILPQFAKLDTSIVAKDARQYPLELGQKSLSESIFEMELPATVKVKYLPKAIDVKNQWGEYSVTYELKRKTLKVSQRQLSKARQISKEEYPAFKQFMEDMAITSDEHIILE